MSPEEISSSYDGWIVVRRWAASCLDLLFLAVLLVAPLAFGDRVFFIAAGVWALFLTAYYPVFEGLTGRTFGKLLCGLKVVDAAGGKPGVKRALLRTLVRLVEVNPFLLGGIPAGIAVMTSRKRQRLGDAAAGTFVLKTEDLPLLRPGSSAAAPAFGGLGEFSLPGGPAAADPSPAPPRPPGKKVLWGLPGALFTTLVSVVLVPVSFREFAEVEKRQPTPISCAKFLADPPKQGWYRVTGCELDLAGGFFQTTTSLDTTESEDASSDEASSEGTSETELEPIEEVIVPVYATREHGEQKTPLVLVTEDEGFRKIVEEMRKLHGKDQATIDQWVEENRERLLYTRDVTGNVRPAERISEAVREAMDGDETTYLADRYVVLAEGGADWDLRPFAKFLVGIAAGLITGLFWLLLVLNGAGVEKRTLSR